MIDWRDELGLRTISRTTWDARLLMAECFVRMAAYGITTLILALFFQQLGITESRIGLFMTLTLLGDVVLSYIVTFYADHLGRRRVLFYASLAMVASGLVFAYSDNYWWLLLAAVVGVISPSGDETGPFKSIEESTLAHLTAYEDRSDVFAWFGMMATLGSALGSLGGGALIHYLQQRMSVLHSYRTVFMVYSGLACVKLVLNMFLSPACEHAGWRGGYSGVASDAYSSDSGEAHPSSEAQSRARGSSEAHHSNEAHSNEAHSNREPPSEAEGASPLVPKHPKAFTARTLRTLIKLCILFGIDSLGGGFMPTAWVVVFFNRKFGISESQLGSLLFTTTLAGSVAVLLSSAVCKRVGPVLAMVLTHLPAAVFNAFIPVSSNKHVAMLLLLARAATTTMDVVPRQVFLTSVVQADERTRVMGVVNVVKTLARSVGPTVTGHFAEHGVLYLSFVFGGAFESVHDVGLLALFGPRAAMMT